MGVVFRMRWLLACALVGSLLGCASTPESARHAVPPTFPKLVRNWNGGKVEEVEFVTDIQLPSNGRIVLGGFQASDAPMPPDTDNTHEPAEKARAQFNQTVAEGVREITKTYVPVDTAPEAPPPAPPFSSAPRQTIPPTLIVRGRLLQLDPGSRAARYWIGFGAGASRVAVEGEVVDKATSRVVARFRHSHGIGAGAFGGDYDQILRDDSLWIGRSLGELLLAYAPPSK